jgi:hypothetical protein
MKSKGSDILLNSEGKGLIGCIGAIILLAAVVFAGIKLGPIYYSNLLFEEDIKNVTSRAGTHGLTNEAIIEDILELARKNDINLTKKDASENIKIDRYAGLVHIEVRYFVPVDFLIMKKTLEFQVKASSFSSI